MAYAPLTMARRHVLGHLYARCDHASSVPVYLNNTEGEMLGYADERDGIFSDSLTFHLSEENCKKLAGGQFDYSFDCEFSGPKLADIPRDRRRLRLTSIVLTLRAGYQLPSVIAPTNIAVQAQPLKKRRRYLV